MIKTYQAVRRQLPSDDLAELVISYIAPRNLSYDGIFESGCNELLHMYPYDIECSHYGLYCVLVDEGELGKAETVDTLYMKKHGYTQAVDSLAHRQYMDINGPLRAAILAADVDRVYKELWRNSGAYADGAAYARALVEGPPQIHISSLTRARQEYIAEFLDWCNQQSKCEGGVDFIEYTASILGNWP